MLRTIALFFITNILVMITASVVFGLLGVGSYVTAAGLDYQSLLTFCFVWGMGYSLVSLLLSKVSAKWMMRIQTITPDSPGEYGWVARKVQELARAAQLASMPEVGVYESDELNAFATGPTRNHALVAVSTGLLQRMNHDEIEGVLAHEMTHITNGDMVRMTLIQGVVNAFVMFFARIVAFGVAQFVREEEQRLVRYLVTILCEIAFGILGSLVVAWFSRAREFRADAGGARLAGRDKMVGALANLERFYDRYEVEESRPALASLKIAGGSRGFSRLFATHPPLAERIAALQQGAMS